jgi:uncharacterized phiE125 gp8 family phage protein
MALVLVSTPAVEPVTLAEAKAHLRVDGTDEDALISALILAAREHCEAATGRVLVQQTWDLKLDRFPCLIEVPLPPLRSVASISYLDDAGASQTLAGAYYLVDAASEPARITPSYGQSWPSTYPVTGAVTVRFVAGYPDDGNSPPDLVANVPQSIKLAMLLLIGHWFEHRSDVLAENGLQVASLPRAVDALLIPYRVWGC